MPLPRRKFLQYASLSAAALLTTKAFAATKKYSPKLSFSTLGCPGWSWDEIVNFAATHGYSGIEIRGILKELDINKSAPFSSPAAIQQTMAQLKQKGLRLVDLGSSCNLHLPEGAERQKNLDNAKQFIDLSAHTNCHYVRVFPNNLPKEQEKSTTLALITKGLIELGEYAKNTGVTVLMETHGDLVHSDDIVTVMQQAQGPHTGLVWDVANMWVITKEPPTEVYSKLKKYIHHTHIKDANVAADGKIEYKLLGQGQVPIFEAIDLLAKNNYNGYYSFEWEKLWHPEIAEPEIALADYPVAMEKHFGKG